MSSRFGLEDDEEYTPRLLSNEDIDKLLSTKYGDRRLKSYAGCFMKDQLEELTPERNKMYVINLDKEGGGGTHWVLVSNVEYTSSGNTHIFYFNSFGLPPPDVVLKFMKRAKDYKGRKKSVLYNTVQVQDSDSVNCGYYVVYVAKLLNNKACIADILGNFHLGFQKWYNEKLIEDLKRTSMFEIIRD